MPPGRPRSFDREAALDRALRLFWERGYEGASMADLLQAMGIGSASLYATYGDKRALFRAAVERYGQVGGDYAFRALAEEPTARAAVERLLRDAARFFTDPEHPRGCLVVSGARDDEELRGHRNAVKAAIRDKIAADPELPAVTDAEALAELTTVLIQGMSGRARDGATRAELEAVADAAMRAWPASPTM